MTGTFVSGTYLADICEENDAVVFWYIYTALLHLYGHTEFVKCELYWQSGSQICPVIYTPIT